MSVEALLHELDGLGIKISADGNNLRLRGPRGAATPELKERVSSAKPALLEILRAPTPNSDGALPAASATTPGDLESSPISGTRFEVAAVLLDSPTYGPVWLVLNTGAAESIREEEGVYEDLGLPIITPDDLTALRGKPAEAIGAALEVARTFPGARVVQ